MATKREVENAKAQELKDMRASLDELLLRIANVEEVLKNLVKLIDK